MEPEKSLEQHITMALKILYALALAPYVLIFMLFFRGLAEDKEF
jgi:hypothetical protein